MATAGMYPVRVDAALDAPLSRWLWLVKWILLIPHYVVLVFLWLAFVLLSVAAFVAILVTGRYPRPIFEFNVGVLRWTWRVQYYAIGVFGTDRYPPFTLEEDPSYPAHLDITYPERLSRGLVLVKWWLLAIPHYIVVGLFTGGGIWLASRTGSQGYSFGGWGLIGILAVIAAVVLLFTGRYPEQIFDFVLGMNRWVLRVAAYAGLMTDRYPPFRLDMGGSEPGATLTVPPQPPSSGVTQWEPQRLGESSQQPGPSGEGSPARQPTGWTAARVISVVAGAVVLLCSLGLLGAGGTALWAQTAKGPGGYLDLGTRTYTTAGYAVASDEVELQLATGGWDGASALFGTARLRVTPAHGTAPVFIGIAPAAAASRYLAGVSHSTVTGTTGNAPVYVGHSGGAPAVPPGRAGIWAARAAGPGTQVLTWPVKSGRWTVVAMNASGSRPVSVRVTGSATLPALPWIAVGLLAGGILVAVAGVVLIVVPVSRASAPRDR